MVAGALTRRNEWNGGRKEAEEGFLKKDFFRSWDKRVLGKYLEFGLREKRGGGGVELKGKREQEAVSLSLLRGNFLLCSLKLNNFVSFL